MAEITIKRLLRPAWVNPETGAPEPAPYLLAVASKSGLTDATLVLAFSEYAGLEAEWEAGVATTVLDAAIDAALVATPIIDSDADLSSAQLSFRTGYQATIE